MSAFVVSKAHIDAMITAAIDLNINYWNGERWCVVSAATANEVGQALVDECVRSVSYRYPNDDVKAGELPGPGDAYYVEPYQYMRTRRFSDAEVRDLVRCYEYQACEHPGWRTSPAEYFCRAVEGKLLSRIPGEGARWGVEADDVGYGTRNDFNITDLLS
jgi:hypothetical protein